MGDQGRLRPSAGFVIAGDWRRRAPLCRIPNPEFPIPARPMPSILPVADETAIADTVLSALRAAGFAARHCLTGKEALRAAGERVHDLAILAVGLPAIGELDLKSTRLNFSHKC